MIELNEKLLWVDLTYKMYGKLKHAKEKGDQEAKAPLCSESTLSLNHQLEAAVEFETQEPNSSLNKWIKWFLAPLDYFQKVLGITGKQQTKIQYVEIENTLDTLESEKEQTNMQHFEIKDTLESKKERKDERHNTEALLRSGKTYKENNQILKALNCPKDDIEIAREQVEIEKGRGDSTQEIPSKKANEELPTNFGKLAV